MQGRAEIQARRLKLKELMPNVELMQKTLGEMNGDADIRGVGNSVAALLGSGNGNLKLLMNDGLVSRNLMEIRAERRVTTSSGKSSVMMRCG
jgi:uncharacterized protein involved in outer membrane biogenesis